MSLLKVCQIIPTLDQGGAEKQMSLLASNLDKSQFESHVITLTREGPLLSQLEAAGVTLHHIGKRGKLDPTALARMTRTLRTLAPDVVHTWLFAANCYGRVAARRARVPTIIAGERCVDPWKTFGHHFIDRRLDRFTDSIVTNTEAVTKFYGKHGRDTGLFHVIPNAVVPVAVTKMSKQELFERLGIPPRKMVVGAVGRLWPQKGYEDLIWAAELLRVAYEDVCFVIIGDGPQLEKLQYFRDKIGAERAVHFVGHRKDAQQLMTAFDILWNGSLYEGQSNTILEAMSAGVPVVASSIPGNVDLVVHEQTGCLYPLGDQQTLIRESLKILRSDETRLAMGEASTQRIADCFSLERMVRSHQDWYRQRVDAAKGIA